MAHDFNNLLTVITGNLELLALRQLDDKARDLIRRADQAAKMGARLAGRLLTIGRRQRLQPVELDLNEITRSMTDVLKRTLGDGIEISSVLRRRSAAGARRCQRGRECHPEPRHQRTRRDARRRQTRCSDDEHVFGARRCRGRSGASTGRLCHALDQRHGHRHVTGDSRTRPRAVLHDKARARHRPRPQHDLWLCQAIRRSSDDLQRGWQGYIRAPLFATRGRFGNCPRAATSSAAGGGCRGRNGAGRGRQRGCARRDGQTNSTRSATASSRRKAHRPQSRS